MNGFKSRMSEDRYALVTGANGGIGSAVVDLLVERGRKVIAFDGMSERAERSPQRDVHRFRVDLATADAFEHCRSAVTSITPSGVSEIVNCAAAFDTNLTDPNKIDQILHLNMVWPYTLLSHLHRLATPDAKVILVSSISSSVATHGSELYSATKAAVEALVRGFAFRYGSRGTRILGVSPGLVRTKMASAVTERPELSALIASQTPAGRIADPVDVARGIVGLLSSDFEWMQGQTIVLDGGRSLGSYERLHDL